MLTCISILLQFVLACKSINCLGKKGEIKLGIYAKIAYGNKELHK